uniref:Protein MON2 homolog n=1 Tax=Globodera rostochiensis TaxID=31243 RepID=A0A914IBJ8_GLORO
MASSVAPGIVQQNDPKKLVEYLMGDLRLLSTEAKKKYNHIKEAAESGLVKVRNISSSASSSDNLLQSFRSLCTEIVHPFLLGCSSKNPRLVQISLQSIQKLLQFLAIDRNAVPGIVNELWALTEAECEELKVLQTITTFVSTELLVTDWALAKCIVLAFRLNFSKDSSVINAASAAVRHLFSTVFERAFQEDGMRGVGTEEMKILPQQKNLAANVQQSLAPPTLRPAAADAFLLLRDLCILIRRENPTWLIGIHKITPILALELLESVVKFYPSIFFRHSEFTELLKGYICPQVIKLIVGEREISLSSSTTNGGVVPPSNSTQNRSLPISAALLTQQQQHHQQQHGQIVTKARDFPIMIRSMRISLALLTNYHSILASQNELILSILLDLLCMPTNSWEAAVAIEVFRKIMAQPTLLKWLCARDEGGKFVELLFSRLTAFLRRCLEEAANDSPSVREDKVGGQQGFIFKGVFLPFDERQLSQKRSILLDWLDKHSAERIPEAYCLSVGFATLVDATGAVCSAVEGELLPDKGSAEGEEPMPEGKNSSTASPEFDVAKELFQVAHPFLTSGLSTLLEFSVDDSVTEHLLNCLTSMITLACKLGNAEAKHSLLKAFCRAALPCQYFSRFVGSNVPAVSMQNISVSNGTAAGTLSLNDLSLKESSVEPTQVVAMGTVCPSPHHPSQYFNTTVMMTAKNLQVARLLINCVHVNAHLLGGCWEMVLTTIQHFVWIIGLRPTSMGTFRAGGETKPASEGGGIMSTTSTSAASTVILTTAASSELPDLNQQLNMLFESTSSLDEVSIHHIIAALCKLSNESMMVAQVSSRETSFFSVAKLLQTALVNLSRLHVFWRPVTAHLIELCGHSNIATREWGAVSLTQLVKSAMKQTLAEFRVTETNKKTPNVEEITKREQLILNPLAAINEIEYLDVRVKQLDCLMRILQADSRPIEAPLWSSVLQIVTSVVVPDSRMNTITDPQLIDQAFRVLSLVIKEFLTVVPFECVEMLVETDALYGQQQIHLNVALASVGQLWDISDFVRRAQQSVRKEEEEKAWLCIYAALGRLCVDARPPVRKSACDTLLQTVAAHGQALGTQRWAEMLTDVLFPMLDRVRHLTQTASTHRSNTSSLGAPNIMIHHSRDTESKQWAETSVKTLGGVVKIFNAQRPMLLQLGGFSDFWSQLLTHIELAAKADNAEMSLAALKNMQDLLFGRQQQTESSHQSIGVRGKQSMANVRTYTDLSANPSLPEPLWLVCWSFWLRIAQAIVSPDCPATLDFVAPSPHTPSNESPFIPSTKKHFVPGLYHLTTLLEMFQQLFHRVRHQIPVEDVRSQRLSQIFQEIAAIPLANDPISISAHNTAEQLHPAQESLLNSIRLVIQEQIESNSPLRPALPDLLRLLLSFFQFAVQPPVNKFSAVFSAAPSQKVVPNTNVQCPPSQNTILFAEVSLKTALEFYTKTVAFDEVLQQTVLTDIVKRLAEPLSLKYRCPSQSTWQLSATTLIKACQVGFPIARENVNLFKGLWPAFAMAIENFLFSPSKSAHPLNADERKRHEFIDCLAIELIRTELLPYAATLPREFMQRIIDILNRGSINTMDSHDVLDAYQQRADLSRVCFDSLLSLSQTDATTAAATATTTRHHQQKSPTTSSSSGGGFLRNTSQTTAACSSLGATAIASLLQRCSKVLNDYAKDEQTAGHFRLPQERIFESISALQAITALIEGFSRNPNNPTLYSHLVTLHPSLVQLIPSSRGDHQVELALMTCLNSYQTLLLLNLHNK